MGHWADASPFHVIAHGGASAYAPANSLEAFGVARAHCATDVEVDVHCTSDGEFVVRHDAVMEGSAPKFLSELSYDEYSRICDQLREPAIRLEQVLQVAEANNLGVYLDVKQVLPQALRNFVETIRAGDHHRKVVVASFRTDIVREVKATAPDVLTSVLFHDPNLDIHSLVRGVGCDFVHPCFDIFKDPLRRFTSEWVARAGSAGAGLIGWNVTTPEMADALVSMNIRGACADDPLILANALGRRRTPLRAP